MGNIDDAKHVFISYVHEDSEAVDVLCAVLDAAQIPYWRDRNDLGPGDAWRAKIREAIRSGSVVFLACFSDASRAKDKSYMNEELTLAVEEFRLMAPGRTWLMPVRFDAGALPDWDLGAGRTLDDLNYTDLFGPNHMANATRLVTTIQRLLGEKHVDAATALAAVEQATAIDRTDLMGRLTKEMLPDPARRIELDDLVAQEVHRLTATLKDEARVAGPLGATADEQVARIAAEFETYRQDSFPFCASLKVAARWGTPDALAPWAGGTQALISAANRTEGGVTSLLRMRHVPGVLSLLTATLASLSSGRWDNLKALVVDRTTRDGFEGKSRSMLEATDIYVPFNHLTDPLKSAIARSVIQGRPVEETMKDFTEQGNGVYHTPEAEWFHAVLRPLFADLWPDEEAFAVEWDRAEAVLGVLAADALNVRSAASGSGYIGGRAHWYGRSTWRSRHSHPDPVVDLQDEFESQGPTWAPLRAGLFGGSEDRARDALATYATAYKSVGSRIGW